MRTIQDALRDLKKTEDETGFTLQSFTPGTDFDSSSEVSESRVVELIDALNASIVRVVEEMMSGTLEVIGLPD